MDSDEIYDFIKEEHSINEALWLKFSLIDTELNNANYELILSVDETVKTYPFIGSENLKTSGSNTYYLREDILTQNQTELTSTVTYATFVDRKNIKVLTSAKSRGIPSIQVITEDVLMKVNSIKELVDGYLIEIDDDLDVKREYRLDFDFNDGFGYQSIFVRLDDIYNQGFFTSAYHYDSNDLGPLTRKIKLLLNYGHQP